MKYFIYNLYFRLNLFKFIILNLKKILFNFLKKLINFLNGFIILLKIKSVNILLFKFLQNVIKTLIIYNYNYNYNVLKSFLYELINKRNIYDYLINLKKEFKIFKRKFKIKIKIKF